MKVVSVAHLKGGVGKTSAAVNIAYLAAHDGQRTLIVDMDAQAAATSIFGLDAGAGGKRVAAAKKSLREEIQSTGFTRLDLLPASLSFRKLPVLLAEKGRGQLKRLFQRVGKGYDLLVVDAPAGLSFESEEIIRASDLILVPVVPSALGLSSFYAFEEFAKSRSKKGRLFAFPSMVDARRVAHREQSEALQQQKNVWDVSIPYAAVVERMATERLPLPLVKRPGKAGVAVQELWTCVANELAKLT